MTLEPQQKLLLGILGLLVAIAGWQWLRPVVLPADVPTGRAVGGRSKVPGKAVELEELRVSDLDAPSAEFHGGRDPFSYGPLPKPPGPTPEQLAEMERQRREQEEARRQLAAAQAAEAAKPHPPVFAMKYLGSFGPQRRRVAVFSDGKSLYNALQGDVLQGRFLIARIGYESVDIKFVGFPNEPAKRLAAGVGP